MFVLCVRVGRSESADMLAEASGSEEVHARAQDYRRTACALGRAGQKRGLVLTGRDVMESPQRQEQDRLGREKQIQIHFKFCSQSAFGSARLAGKSGFFQHQRDKPIWLRKRQLQVPCRGAAHNCRQKTHRCQSRSVSQR